MLTQSTPEYGVGFYWQIDYQSLPVPCWDSQNTTNTMNNNSKPFYWLGAEALGILTLLALYIDSQRYPLVELAPEQAVLVGVTAVYSIYWGATKVDESDYSHPPLVYNRIVKPAWRAGKQSVLGIVDRVPSLGFIINFLSESRDQSESRKVVNDFVTIAFDELAMDSDLKPSGDEQDALAELIARDTTHPKRDGYRRIASNLFEQESTIDEKTRLILVFCREYVRTEDTIYTGENIHDLQSGISRALSASGCDFEQWNNTAEQVLSAYGSAHGAIHHDEPCSSDPLRSTPENPPKEYYADFIEHFLPFRDRNALSDELVATIIDVVDRGELDQSAIARDIDQHIEEERERVRRKIDNRDAYLLLSLDSGLSGTAHRDKIYERYPDHIRFGKTTNKNNISSLPEDIYLTTDVIFTDRMYDGSEDFLADIKDLIPDSELDGGLLAVYELKLEDPAYEPSKEVAQRHLPDWTRDSVSAIDFLETGDSSRAVTEIAIDNLLGEKIRVRDLLAAIPVNVFVDAPPKLRNLIDAAYDDIKNELEVGELYDWGDYEPEDISTLLIEFDEKENEERIGSDEEWHEVAEQMIENARACERAAQT